MNQPPTLRTPFGWLTLGYETPLKQSFGFFWPVLIRTHPPPPKNLVLGAQGARGDQFWGAISHMFGAFLKAGIKHPQKQSYGFFWHE